VTGYFEQGNRLNRNTKSVDMKHAGCVHCWATQVPVIGFRMKYNQTVNVRCAYKNILRRFA
jgi:hypothetical protein